MTGYSEKLFMQYFQDLLDYNNNTIEYLYRILSVASERSTLMDHQSRLDTEKKIQKTFHKYKTKIFNQNQFLVSLNRIMKTQHIKMPDLIEHCINRHYNDCELRYDPTDATEPLQVKVITAKQSRRSSTLDTYKMNSDPRGDVLIITQTNYKNNPLRDNRPSGIYDERNLRDLFNGMGFGKGIDSHLNLTSHQIVQATMNFAEKIKTNSADSVFVFLSGHCSVDHFGNELFFGIDKDIEGCSPIRIVDILHCILKATMNRPRPIVFVIDGCRTGNEYKHESAIQKFKADLTESKNANREVFVFFSTHNHSSAYVNSDNCSWFASVFCEVMAKRAWNTPFHQLVILIRQRLFDLTRNNNEPFQQLPDCIEFEVFKELYINPGFQENN